MGGEISQKVKYLQKASAKVINKLINKLYAELTARRMQKTNEHLTEVLISRFSSVLQAFDAVESSESQRRAAPEQAA